MTDLAGLWREATEHPFLHAVRDATIAPVAFDRWLVQDVHFVADLLNFQALLLARSPRVAQPVLAAGCVGLVDELAWFDEQATARGLALDGPRLPATDAYRALLDRLDAEPYPAAITGLWVIEQVYLDAWTVARSPVGQSTAPSPFTAAVEHWTNPEFAAYVRSLGELATPADHADLVADVLRHEVAFWDTALS